jgi:hypothetical protein
MLDWLLAAILFWVAAALYFGGLEHDVHGGTGFRQFLGLLLTYAIFLVIWGVLYKIVGAQTAKGVLIASAVAALLIPLEARLGFLLVGARVRRNSAEAH